MTPFRKMFLILSLSQAVCLALGLWMQNRMVDAAHAWHQEQQGQDALAEDSQGMTLGVRLIGFGWVAGLQAVVGYLILSRSHHEHDQHRTKSAEDTLQREKDLIRTRNAVIFGLAKLAESRDPDTGQHLERIASYSTKLATALRRLPQYREIVTPAFVRLIGISSALHDIGKVGIEDAILLKPGSLDSDERSRMQCHAAVGGECIRQIELRLGSSNFLQMARDIAYYHHERWDGEGYPYGMAGDEIPLPARIVAVADVYDALSVRRVYKDAFPHEKCVEIIREEAGKQFDPVLVDVFLKIEREFAEIAQRFSDAEAIRAEKSISQQISEELECDDSMSSEEEETLKAVMQLAVTSQDAEALSQFAAEPQVSAS